MRALDSHETEQFEIAPDIEQWPAELVLQWALDKFSPKLALACSFQAEESVLIDMMNRIAGSNFRIFTLDTGRLNQETYDCMDAIRGRYGVCVEVYFPDAMKVQDMARAHGLNLFYNSVELRKMCCAVRKVELDRDHGSIVKINPLVEWGSDQVWNYIRENNVPYNRLHNQAYLSIGCAPAPVPSNREKTYGRDAGGGKIRTPRNAGCT
jgi:phosphoadenosine phosphosulfate reductase